MAFGIDRTSRRFAHFCRTGDPEALADVFDATAGRLMRVALWLSGDRADAEDLLQRTFLQLIETREQFRVGAPVLPWMIGVLSNQARKLRRERGRDRSPPPADERLVDPHVEAARRELESAVQSVQERLGEPYREVVRLHLQQGWNAKEIAEHLGRPAGTVRTQLMRALEQLRRRLPGGFVAGLAALASLDAAAVAAARGPVLQAARAAAPTVGASGGGITLGGVLMMKKVAVLTLLLALGGLALWAAARPPEPEAATSEEGVAGQGPLVSPDPDPSGQAGRDDQLPTGSRELVVAGTGDARTARLTVTIRWQDDGSPASGLGISGRLVGFGASSLMRSAITNDDGVAVLEHLPAGEWYVDGAFVEGLLQEPGAPTATRTVTLRAGAHRTVDVSAVRTSTASGVVLDHNGARVAGATIWVSDTSSWSRGWRAGSSAADGSFSVPMRGFHYIGARCDGHTPSFTQDYQARKGPHREIELRLRAPAGRLEGIVRDAAGQPVRGARVRIGPRGGGVQSSGKPGVRYIAPNPEERVTDEEGRFVATEVPPGTGPLWIWSPGFGPLREQYEGVAGVTKRREFVLQAGASVAGVVRDGGGTPIAEAVVRFGDEFYNFPQARTKTDDLGRFRLDDLPAWEGGTVLTARWNRRSSRRRLVLRAGATSTWDPVLADGATIGGTVLGPGGRGLAGLEIGAVHTAYQRPQRWHTTDADGRFVITNVGDEPRTLRIARDEIVLRDVKQVAPGTKDLVVRLTEADLPTVRLRGRIVDWRGQGVAGIVAVGREGSEASVTLQLEDGRFDHGPAPAGRYTLLAFLEDFGNLPLAPVELEPHQDRILEPVLLRVPGQATITATDAAGEPVKSGHVFVRTPTGGQAGTGTMEGGRMRFTSLQPGRYFVDVTIDGRHAPESLTATFTVETGRETVVAVRGKPSTRVRIRCVDPSERQPPPVVRYVCTAVDTGDVVGIFATWPGAREPLTVQRRLPIADYELVASSSDGRRARVTFSVTREDFERRGARTVEVELAAR